MTTLARQTPPLSPLVSRQLARRELDFDDNTAPWLVGAPEIEPSPPLRGIEKADVVIIGGGFTGLSTAWNLCTRHPNLRIILLEARRVANGASGRNGGQMLNWVNGVDTADEQLTKRVFDLTRSGIDDIVSLIRAHDLRVRHARDGALEVQCSAEGAEHAQEKAERLARWGIPLRYLQGAELNGTLQMTGARGALLDPTAGQLNGVDYLRELARLLVARGVVLYEDSPVLRIEEGATHRVITAGGEVCAPALVLGTGGYTHRLGYFRLGAFPLHSHALATAPLTPEERVELGWRATSGFCDDLDRISYGCLSVDGRIVFGGGSNAAYDYGFNGPTAWRHNRDAAFKAIADRLFQYFPRLRKVRHHPPLDRHPLHHAEPYVQHRCPRLTQECVLRPRLQRSWGHARKPRRSYHRRPLRQEHRTLCRPPLREQVARRHPTGALSLGGLPCLHAPHRPLTQALRLRSA